MALDRVTAPTAAHLRVSSIESFAAKWLAPRLYRFHHDCPDLKVRVETGNDHADLVRDGIDVAIRYGPGGYTGVCRSEEHTSELQSLMRISYAVFCLKKKTQQ